MPLAFKLSQICAFKLGFLTYLKLVRHRMLECFHISFYHSEMQAVIRVILFTYSFFALDNNFYKLIGCIHLFSLLWFKNLVVMRKKCRNTKEIDYSLRACPINKVHFTLKKIRMKKEKRYSPFFLEKFVVIPYLKGQFYSTCLLLKGDHRNWKVS